MTNRDRENREWLQHFLEVDFDKMKEENKKKEEQSLKEFKEAEGFRLAVNSGSQLKLF